MHIRGKTTEISDTSILFLCTFYFEFAIGMWKKNIPTSYTIIYKPFPVAAARIVTCIFETLNRLTEDKRELMQYIP